MFLRLPVVALREALVDLLLVINDSVRRLLVVLLSANRIARIVVLLLRGVQPGRRHAVGVLVRPLAYGLYLHLVDHSYHGGNLWRRAIVLFNILLGKCRKGISLFVIFLGGQLGLDLPLLELFDVLKHLLQHVGRLLQGLTLQHPLVISLLFNVLSLKLMIKVPQAFDLIALGSNLRDQVLPGAEEPVDLLADGGREQVDLNM